MKESREKPKEHDFPSVKMGKILLILFVPLVVIVFSIGALPTTYSLLFILSFFDLTNPFHILFLPILAIFEVLLFIISEALISGIVIKIFRIKYDEGEYEVTEKYTKLLKMTLFHLLYRIPFKLIDFLGIDFLRIKYLSLVGLKIGKNSSLGSTGVFIMDPCLVEIGDNTLIGAYTHIIPILIEKEKIISKKIKIGSNCLISGDTILHPGVTIEDDVMLGSRSLVLKNQTLEKGKVYAGTPAKELKSSKKLLKQDDGVNKV